MADVNFIEFGTQPFFIERTSPYTNHYEVYGIRMLPNNPLPYVQTTNVSGGIYLEDWVVSAVKCSDKPIITLGTQNLLLQSDQFDNATWEKTAIIISDVKIIAASSGGGVKQHYISQTITKTSDVKTYTASFYVKASEYNRIRLHIEETTSPAPFNGWAIVDYNLATNLFTYEDGGNGFIFNSTSQSDEGDGWYRINVNFTSNDCTDIIFRISLKQGSNDAFLGDDVSGIFIKHPQLKEGALGDYVATTTTQITLPDTETIGTDITDYFMVENVFTDDNGDNQFTWSLTNVPFDFGYELITLKVTQLIGETFYSNWFQLTDYDSDKYIRVDFRNYNQDIMQSIELPIAFKQEFNPVEIETYYETSTKNTVINTIKSQSYENWLSKIISNDLLLRVIRVFTYKYTYVNLLRCNLFESIEQKEYTAEENFNDNIIKLTFNKSDVYNPLTQFIPVVSPLVPSITLNSVIASGISAIYNFSYANFVPEYLVFEYSDDEVTWVSENKAITNPQILSFNGIGTWYFRVKHPLAISNTITLELGSTLIANDDTITVAKGSVTEISVLFNDEIVGATTITAVSTATNGTLEIIESGTKIRYTHDNGASTSDSFTYTISNGITSDTATVAVSIVEFGIIGMWFVGSTTKPNACSIFVDEFVDFYYSGGGIVPSLGSTIYSTLADGYEIFNGYNLWYQITGGKIIRIDTNGVVTGNSVC